MTEPLRNIGPKSAAWLRQVGVRTQDDLAAVGAVGAFLRVRRAGFKPSLNLLYSLEGALVGCHWQQVPPPRRQQLQAELEQAIAEQPAPRGRPLGGDVVTVHRPGEESESDPLAALDAEDGRDTP
ncbi:TfoX/Sxy family protein [[Pseudomonas] boreopolis]|uniref:TfoX/Sxy family protein n=1 Tax=Xanthomonas boreopolis TaxID=86183 RepID=UPI003D560BAB